MKTPLQINIPAGVLSGSLALLSLASCSDPSFCVNGVIEDADGKTVTIEKADHAGYWIALDSVKLGNSGKYKFKQPAPAAPEIYRLSLDGSHIYFPVDSIENITIDAPAARFATGFTITGSDDATSLGNFEKELISYAPKLANADSARNFKRRVYANYLQEAKGSVVSYYILTKTVNDKPLFGDDEDYRYFAAVATSFRQFRPEDPRTAILEQTATDAIRRANAAMGKKNVVQAEELNFIPVMLPDENGSNVALADIAGKGKPTLLIFSNLTDDATPAMNIELKKLVDAGSVNIYNVSFDDDALLWRNAARNLPWTTVYADMENARKLVGSYQLTNLPVIFLIVADGNLKARYSSVAELKKAL